MRTTGACSLEVLTEAHITLENEREFYEAYQLYKYNEPKAARILIEKHLKKAGFGSLDQEAREELRQYFDDRYWPGIDVRHGHRNVNSHIRSRLLAQPITPPVPSTTPQLSEIPMAATKFLKTVTYLNGADISLLTSDQIYTALGEKQERIDTLEAMKVRPKRLEAEIAEAKAELAAAVAYIDSIDTAKA